MPVRKPTVPGTWERLERDSEGAGHLGGNGRTRTVPGTWERLERDSEGAGHLGGNGRTRTVPGTWEGMEEALAGVASSLQCPESLEITGEEPRRCKCGFWYDSGSLRLMFSDGKMKEGYHGERSCGRCCFR